MFNGFLYSKGLIVLSDPKAEHWHELPHWIKVDLGVMAMKMYPNYPNLQDRNLIN